MKPEIIKIPGGYSLEYAKEQLTIEATSLHHHRDGRFTAQLTIKTCAPGYAEHIHQSQLNLTSARARQTIEKLLAERFPASWSEILEQVSYLLLQKEMEGESPITLTTEDEIKPLQYMIDPVCPYMLPTTIFGEPKTGKSYIALLMGIMAWLPWDTNPLGFNPMPTASKVLYLDWETDQDEIRLRLKELQLGMGLPYIEIEYRRCAMPLADSVEQIRKIVYDNHIGFLIVDSLGGASGGNLNESETALRFFQALRQIEVTSLCLGHTSKEHSKNKSIIGHTLYTAYSRQIWETKKVQDEGENSLSIGLFHRCSNSSKLHKPIGLHFSFDNSGTVVEREDVRGVAGLIEHLSVKSQLQDILQRGSMDISDIADELGQSKDTIRVILNRNKKDFVRVGKRWGLLAADE